MNTYDDWTIEMLLAGIRESSLIGHKHTALAMCESLTKKVKGK